MLILIMAIALSLDAFSVALILGLLENNNNIFVYYSVLVGILHFIMPSFGAITNSLIFNSIIINSNKLLGITLLVLAISMIFDLKKDNKNINKTNITILGLSVSIDSYFAGLGLKSIQGFSLIYFLVFSVFSCIISFAGCKIGKIGNDKLGKLSNYLAIIILLLLSVKYILFN